MSEYLRAPVIGASGQIGGSVGEGIFDPFGGGGPPQHYSQMWYEAQEPVVGWAFEKKPGLPYRPGMQDVGLVLIGPSMGTAGDEAGGLLSRIWPWAVGGAVALSALMLVGAVSVPFLSPRRNPKGWPEKIIKLKGSGKKGGGIYKLYPMSNRGWSVGYKAPSTPAGRGWKIVGVLKKGPTGKWNADTQHGETVSRKSRAAALRFLTRAR
jgi:hypothetical protein